MPLQEFLGQVIRDWDRVLTLRLGVLRPNGDRGRGPVEVDVGPGEGLGLAETQPRECRKLVGDGVALAESPEFSPLPLTHVDVCAEVVIQCAGLGRRHQVPQLLNRQGAAQCVSLNQTAPQPIVVRAFSKSQEVATSEEVVLDTHELTAEAVATCDLALLRRAMLTDPLVNSIAVADKLIAELLDAERDMIPDCWY